jgi:hypothetical protein
MSTDFAASARIDSPERVLRRLERLARLLDSQFRIPGLGIRFGLDSIIGLAPGIGDAVGLALSGYIVMEAWRLGLPSAIIMRMIANLAVDTAVGSVPVVGDLFDVAWKANRRNLQHIRRHVRGSRS